jgi:hypothetical protein
MVRQGHRARSHRAYARPRPNGSRGAYPLPVSRHPSLWVPPRGQWRTIRGDEPRVMASVASNPVKCRVFVLTGHGDDVLDGWAPI